MSRSVARFNSLYHSFLSFTFQHKHKFLSLVTPYNNRYFARLMFFQIHKRS